MQNQWLSANLAGIAKIRRLLMEMEYLPIFQDYPLRTIQGLITGFEIEVNKLQEQIDQLKKENEKLKSEAEKTVSKESVSENA
jgi:uncharacterized coiled-coil protein SlyX